MRKKIKRATLKNLRVVGFYHPLQLVGLKQNLTMTASFWFSHIDSTFSTIYMSNSIHWFRRKLFKLIEIIVACASFLRLVIVSKLKSEILKITHRLNISDIPSCLYVIRHKDTTRVVKSSSHQQISGIIINSRSC